MGWWTNDEQGRSFLFSDSGTGMVWGDGPADIFDDALDRIVVEFEQKFERRPTPDELIAGLRFSLHVYSGAA